MEIIAPLGPDSPRAAAVLFDFDGTLSTLRRGWEGVMRPLMLEMIAGNLEPDGALIREVDEYIDQSTGIQTIHQMKWLSDMVHAHRPGLGVPTDPWWYKAEYNRRLMKPVQARIDEIASGKKTPDEFLVKGSRAFLEELARRGVPVYVASGTDHADVAREAGVLGVMKYFAVVAGAPEGREDCSKEAVLRQLVTEKALSGGELAVIGDGKVEIRLGRSLGAKALGLASDEAAREGINRAKRTRLIAAGAHAITGDFLDFEAILHWMGL